MAPDARCRGCGIPLAAGPAPHQGRTYRGRLVGACRICESIERRERRRARPNDAVDVVLTLAEIPLVIEALNMAPTGDWEPWQRAALKLVVERIEAAEAKARTLELPFGAPETPQ